MTNFYVRRINLAGGRFFLRPNGEWVPEFNAGIGGYALRTWKTQNGARRVAARLSVEYRGQTVSVLSDGTGGPVESFTQERV